jgi:hypothetical protein
VKLKLLFPLRQGKPAELQVIADDPSGVEDGFLRVKIGGAKVKIVPCSAPADPGVDKKKVLATDPPPTHKICAKPPWAQGDQVTFELYDVADALVHSLDDSVQL